MLLNLDMTNSLAREIVKYRKKKGLNQEDVAKGLGLKRSTYAKKEAEGDFTPDEIPGLYRVIGGDRERLLALAKENERLVIENWKEYLITNAINNRATLRVLLMAVSEILAKQRGESVTKVLGELTMAVEGERSMNFLK